jgi:hypothetical protein
MFEVIKQIIDADKNAQDVVEQANKKSSEIKEELGAEIANMREAYMQRAGTKISQKETKLRQRAEKKWAQEEQQYEVRKEELEKVYAENKERWISEIVSQVIGK